jgi:integrase
MASPGLLESLKIAPKSVRNIYVTLQIMWKPARAWGYVAHDAVCQIVLPSPRRSERFFFTLEEVQKILAGAEEPYRTFYWLAAETGLRAGELCGLRVDDLDFDRRLLRVEQSSWRGNIQQPKTVNSVRSFASLRKCPPTCESFCRDGGPTVADWFSRLGTERRGMQTYL